MAHRSAFSLRVPRKPDRNQERDAVEEGFHEEFAAELLDVYAKRAARPGLAFRHDKQAYASFAAGFASRKWTRTSSSRPCSERTSGSS